MAHYESTDFQPTLAPAPGPIVTPEANKKATPSPVITPTPAPTRSPTVLPTPLATGVELTRPGLNVAAIAAGLIGLVCAGYIAYMGLTIIRK